MTQTELRTVSRACRLCGSAGPHQTLEVREMMFGVRERYEYFRCAGCDTLQIVEALQGDELMRHYPENYYSYNASAQPRVSQWLVTQHDSYKLRSGGRLFGGLLSTPLLDGVVRVLLGGDVITMLAELSIDRDARILDVGCGGGELLDRLSRVGFTELSGVDPFIPADDVTAQGVPVLKRDLSGVTGEFDLVMFNHSLEHMVEPVATLELARARLAPGGVCLVRVPTTSSEAWETYGADWVQIDAPRHVFVPSRRGMTVAAEQAGLRVEAMLDDSNLGQFLGSEAYRRDVPVTDPKILRMFGPRQLWRWEKRAAGLNGEGRGDQTGFVLRSG